MLASDTLEHLPRVGPDQTASALQVEQWEASQEEFQQFLVDSRIVYQAFDEMVKKSEYNIFENTGLERV